jgi:mRNA interferase MazF
VVCDVWEVVVVPFPFSDREAAKRRPALVLSRGRFNAAGHTVLAMITTQAHHPWPGDVELHDTAAAGLPLPCIVRLKLFTLDARLILRRIGALSGRDRNHVAREVSRWLA